MSTGGDWTTWIELSAINVKIEEIERRIGKLEDRENIP